MKRLDPEIKALRAIVRALEPLTNEQRQRDLEWLVACYCGLSGYKLPPITASQAALPPPESASKPRPSDPPLHT